MQRGKVIDSSLWVKEQAENKLIEGHLKSAIPLLERLVRLGRNDLSLQEFAYARLGDSYISLRRFDRAEKYLKKAVNLNSGESRYHYLLSLVYSASGMISEVIRELEHAVTLSPEKSEYQRILGWARIVCGENEDGIRHIRKAIKLNRKNVYAYADLASYYMKVNEFDKAREVITHGLSEVADSSFLLRAKVVVERARSDYRNVKEQEKKTKLRIAGVKDQDFHKVRKSLSIGMNLSRYSKTQKTSAERIWYDFYKMRKLKIKRPEIWAASLEYTLIRLDLTEEKTQREVALKYGVSESVISSRFNDICRTLNIKAFDRRYTAAGDSLLDTFDSLLKDE